MSSCSRVTDSQDRQINRSAATSGVEEGARLAQLATERAAQLRDALQEERRELAESRRLTFQQKVPDDLMRS